MKIFGHVIPSSQVKICSSSILRHFKGHSFAKFTYVVCWIQKSGTWWKEKLLSLPFIFANEGSTFFFLRSLKLPSIQFQQNGHFTEEDGSVKEHSLVRFPQYHWNAKQAEVLNFRPDKAWSCDSYSIACRCLNFVFWCWWYLHLVHHRYSWKVPPAVQD